MARQKVDRSLQVTIRLEPKIMDGLRDISDRIGIPPSTIAGLAIGEYVAKAQAAYGSQTSMADTMAREMAKVIGGPLAAHFEGKSIDELKALFGDDESPEKQADWTEVEDD